MKKVLYLFAAIALFASCKGGTSTDGTAAKTDSASGKKDSLPMAYKASYSSSFTISDNAKNEQLVLQSYKDWEDNTLKNAPTYLADTVTMDFATGKSMKAPRDGIVKEWQNFRDSLSSVKLNIVAVTNLHSTDKNADWVGVWYVEIDTYKTGKVDSAFFQDDNMMVNGKMAYISSKRRPLLPMKK
ncbi:MAG TPA: hypothetical protein VL442_17150 [Mucilaginibacter sp.]|nr:hypothetical protein [Mucilaginibacter sp.]